MHILVLFLFILVIGLIAGAIARAVVPGRHKMSIGSTILLGVVGSVVGGLLGYLIFGKDGDEGFVQFSGIIGSVIGAIIVLLLWTKFRPKTRA